MDLNPPPPSSSSGFANFPILAIALLAIMVTGLLLVSYYIVVIKCCINRPHGAARGPRIDDSSWLTFSPTDLHNRGVDEVVLRDIPTIKYKANSSRFGSNRVISSSNGGLGIGERSFRGCAVCLSEFEDQEMLRVLPHCGHVFHLDCIDVWLINTANCPLCRSNILGAPSKRAPLDHIVAPTSSPQEIIPISLTTTAETTSLEDPYVVIEIEGESDSNNKGGRMDQAIRRSFSMDSVTDRRLLMQVQQIMRQNRVMSNEVTVGSSSNRSFRRSFFSFGQGQSSKSTILPIQSDV